MGVNLTVLFVCVVAFPAARLTLGPTLRALHAKFRPKYKKKKAQRADEDLRDTAWAPSLEVAPVHPELMAQSYRNVRRVQQLQDTAQLAVDNAQYREQSKRTASRRRNED